MLNEEECHQVTVFDWIRLNKLDNICFHPANERKCSPAQGAKLKRLGVKKGVSDIFVMTARNGYHGLIIELKSKNGRASAEQQEFLQNMRMQGYNALLCYGADEAIKAIESYLCGTVLSARIGS